MTLSDLQGHAPNASLLKCEFSYSCAETLTRFIYFIYFNVAHRAFSAIAELSLLSKVFYRQTQK